MHTCSIEQNSNFQVASSPERAGLPLPVGKNLRLQKFRAARGFFTGELDNCPISLSAFSLTGAIPLTHLHLCHEFSDSFAESHGAG